VVVQACKIITSIDSRCWFVQYSRVLDHEAIGIAVDQAYLIDMEDPPWYLKSLKDFFHQLKSKSRGGKQYVKYHIMHDIPLDDIIEILKEELETHKFYMKAQAVQSISVETTG